MLTCAIPMTGVTIKGHAYWEAPVGTGAEAKMVGAAVRLKAAALNQGKDIAVLVSNTHPLVFLSTRGH